MNIYFQVSKAIFSHKYLIKQLNKAASKSMPKVFVLKVLLFLCAAIHMTEFINSLRPVRIKDCWNEGNKVMSVLSFLLILFFFFTLYATLPSGNKGGMLYI